MKVYQINYDLRNKRNYKALYEKIKSYGTWAKPLESCWIIVADKNAEEVRDELSVVMDADDGLLVTGLSGNAAWRCLDFDSDSTMTDWLKSNLNPVTA